MIWPLWVCSSSAASGGERHLRVQSVLALEELHGALVLLGCGAAAKGAEVATSHSTDGCPRPPLIGKNRKDGVSQQSGPARGEPDVNVHDTSDAEADRQVGIERHDRLDPPAVRSLHGLGGKYRQDHGAKDVSPRGLGSAIRMIQYFINRGGKSLSARRRAELERAKRILQRRAATPEPADRTRR